MRARLRNSLSVTVGAVALFALGALLGPVPAHLAAQEAAAGGDIAQIYRVTPKEGHGYDFEEGVKRYFEDVADADAPWAWFIWEIITGEDTGSYMVGTFGHAWADFDQQPDDPSGIQASFRANIEPHVAHAEGSIWAFDQELSRGTPDGSPSSFAQVYFYRPEFGTEAQVRDAFVQVKEAAEAAQWAGSMWEVYVLVNGGVHPQLAVVLQGDSFADFAEPDPAMDEMLSEQLGEEAAMELFGTFSAAMAGEHSEMLAFREDLSYVPEGEM